MAGKQVLITSLFSLMAALIAAVTVHWLTRSREHEAWIRDCEKEEWRELMTALANAELAAIGLASMEVVPDFNTERAPLWREAGLNAARVMMDRIYIADEIKQMQLMVRWSAATNTFSQNHDLIAAIEEFTDIRQSLIRAATKRRKLKA